MGPSKLDANIARTKRGVSSDFRWRHLGHAIRVRMVDAIMRRIRSQTGKRAMMELDDHLLRDIGLSRSELHAAAFGILPLTQAAGEALHDRCDPAASSKPSRLNHSARLVTYRPQQDAVTNFSCIGGE